MLKRITFLFLLSVLILSPFASAQAQTASASQNSGLTISPPIAELNFSPGQTYSETIKINNPTNALVTVYPLASNFVSQGETGVPAVEATDQNTTSGLAGWISFSQSKLALTPEQEIEFQYKIAVPANAEPGGQYASILFASEPPPTDKIGTQVSLISMIGSLILGRVAGDITEKADLVQFSTNKIFYFKPPVDLILRIGNTGNIHFAPKGEINISNWGKNVATLDINPQNGNVLPNSIRRFEGLSYTGHWYSFGKFSSKLTMSYGQTDQTLTGNLVFYIIPWWAITIFVLIIIAIIFLISKIGRKKKKNVSYAKFLVPPTTPSPKDEFRLN